MPRLAFTAHLAQVGPQEERQVQAATVIEALDAVFSEFPRLQGYVLDDQRRLRRHVVIFIDGERAAPETALQRSVAPETEIYVLQALSGG